MKRLTLTATVDTVDSDSGQRKYKANVNVAGVGPTIAFVAGIVALINSLCHAVDLDLEDVIDLIRQADEPGEDERFSGYVRDL